MSQVYNRAADEQGESPLDFALKGQGIVVTGGASGIGRAVVSLLSRCGACVIAVDRLERHSRIAAARPSLVLMETEVGTDDIGEHILLIYLLYPNTVYLLQRHHVEVYSFYPGTSASNCVVRTALLRPVGKLADRAQTLWDKNWAFLCESVYDEDFSTAALVQHSIESGAIDNFVFGRNEDALQYFHANIKRSLNENILT